MAIGIVSESDFDKELERLRVPKKNGEELVLPGVVIAPKSPGRGKETDNVPDSVRKFIAEEALMGTPKRNLIETFGVSNSSVNAYANGDTSTATYGQGNGSLKKHTDKVKERLRRKAEGKIAMALGHMTEDKFASAELPVLSRVAESMASVVERLSDKQENTGPAVQFVMYAPRIEKEEHYQVIDIEQ